MGVRVLEAVLRGDLTVSSRDGKKLARMIALHSKVIKNCRLRLSTLADVRRKPGGRGTRAI